jgi:Lytic transglycolase
MFLGVCGSFAVIPAVAMVNGASATTRRPSRPVVDYSVLLGSPTLAAWALSDVGMTAVAPGGAAAQPLAMAAGQAAVGVGMPPPADGSGGFLAVAPPADSPLTLPFLSVPPTTLPPTTVLPAGGPPTLTITEVPRAPLLAQTPISVSKSGGVAGVASWLNTIPAGTCANNGAPMGATITVTNGAGVSITCRVVSRGPFVSGRIVDLAEPTFSRLGSVSQGLVAVTVSW